MSAAQDEMEKMLEALETAARVAGFDDLWARVNIYRKKTSVTLYSVRFDAGFDQFTSATFDAAYSDALRFITDWTNRETDQ